MSSVSPSEGNLAQYYQKSFSNLEDQHKNELKKNQNKREEELERLKNNYSQSLEKKDKDTEDVFQYTRDASKQALDKEKDKYRSTVEQLKENAANTLNETQTSLNKQSKTDINRVESQLEDNQKKNAELREKDHQALDKMHGSEISRRSKEVDEIAEKNRVIAADALKQQREGYQTEIEKLRGQLYNKKGLFSEGKPPEELHKKQIQELYDASQARHEKDQLNLEARDAGERDRVQEQDRVQTAQIKNLTNEQKEESRNLNEKVHDLNEFNQTAEKRRGTAEAQIIKEHESNDRIMNDHLNEAYKKNVDKLHNSLDQQKNYFIRNNTNTLKERDAQFTRDIANSNKDKYAEIKGIQNQANFQATQTEREKQHEIEVLDKSIEPMLGKVNQDHAKTLENQASKYNSIIAQSKEDSNQQIESLKTALHTQKTSPDSQLVPIEADSAIRRSVINEYEKTLKTEVEKNKLAAEQARQKNNEQYQQALENHAERETNIIKENSRNQFAERSAYLGSVQDVEFFTETKLHEQEVNHEREKDNLIRQFSSMMERQRKDFESNYAAARSNSEARISAIQQEADLSARLAQRTMTAKKNEMVREYEKKFADQKMDFTLELDDVKSQAQVELRELARRSKIDLEEQGRAYEQKITQLEAQFKERERYSAQNYTDEIDRTKRTYDLNNKKKS